MKFRSFRLLLQYAFVATFAAAAANNKSRGTLFFPDCDDQCQSTIFGPKYTLSLTDDNGECVDECVFWLFAYFRRRHGWECGTCKPAVLPGIRHLLVTGNWLSGDFTVVWLYPTTDPDSDGKVFGVSPSDGSLTFELLVHTTSLVGPFLPADTNVAHPVYGYTDVSLPCGATFGTATWDTSSISTKLPGPDSSPATLWVNENLDGNTPPTRASFRMIGTSSAVGQDARPAVFVGGIISWSNYQLDDSNFWLGEFPNGEEICSNDFEFSFGKNCP